MNWEKAKTVLIVALLITDLFLAGVLYVDRIRVAPAENAAAFHRETKSLFGCGLRNGHGEQFESPLL